MERLRGLILRYRCYLANARYFARVPELGNCPPRWREVYEESYGAANYWRARAMAIKEEIRQRVRDEQRTKVHV